MNGVERFWNPYLKFYDPTGCYKTAKRHTDDGQAYPFIMLESWKLKPVKWTDEVLTPTPKVLHIPRVWICCGPDAPFPLPPTPEQILDGARWFALHGPNEEREARELREAAERELTLASNPEVASMVSAKGGKFGYVRPDRQDVYRALRRQGKTKKAAARIANAGGTHVQRVAMAKKAARTRKRRGGK
jgi:hypothetical protein